MISYFSIVQVHFVFLLIKFHCAFFIPYKILPNYIYYIAFRLGSAHASLVPVCMYQCLGKHWYIHSDAKKNFFFFAPVFLSFFSVFFWHVTDISHVAMSMSQDSQTICDIITGCQRWSVHNNYNIILMINGMERKRLLIIICFGPTVINL